MQQAVGKQAPLPFSYLFDFLDFAVNSSSLFGVCDLAVNPFLPCRKRPHCFDGLFLLLFGTV
jgi:hypothetical protein